MSAEPATTATPPAASPIASLSPAYFALVMATGIVSLAADQRGFHGAAVALLWLNLAFYVVLWAVSLLRLARYPRRMLDDLTSHQKGAGFLTVVAGTNVLGSQLALIVGRPGIAAILWWFGLALWGVLLYAFLAAVTFREPKPDLGMGMSGVWLLLVVSTESVAVLGVVVAPQVGVARSALRRPPDAPDRGDALHRRDRADRLSLDLLHDGRRAGDPTVLDQHGRAGDHDPRRREL